VSAPAAARRTEPVAPSPAPAGAPSSVRRPLPLVLRLAALLDEANVAYCHWKSNEALDRSLSGDNDLDLLVHRGDVRRFTEILSFLGFTRAQKRGATAGGIESFYGYDAQADRLVHVHAHYQLVVGHDCTKNYSLPIEDPYIRSAARDDVLRVPAPEFEYVVLVIRMTLKHCTWDEILWCALRGRRAGPAASERREFADLHMRVDEQRTASILREHLPYVDAALFDACVEALAAEPSARRRIRTARRLERTLQVHARRSRRVDRLLRIAGRIVLAAARRTKRLPKNRVAGGGAIVAVTGGDGAGKTTALATLGGWLGAVFDTRVVHLGKPRWSATTYATRASLKAASLTAGFLARVAPIPPTRRLTRVISTYRPLVWLACTARDRHLAYRRARRHAIDGRIVLCDRYPHPRLTSMEVPQIERLSAGRLENRLVRALIRLERRYHLMIAPPELLVVLRVDPETAVSRKSDERPDSVRARGAEVWSIDWRAAGVPVVDASQPEDAVARELKSLVWSVLG
jgi:thymidylate kinase